MTDGAFSDQPGYLLSGDFVFSGDLGRPDPLDEAAGGIDTRFEGAKQLFASLRDKFLTLLTTSRSTSPTAPAAPPAARPRAPSSSTVGYERLYPGGDLTWPRRTTRPVSSPSSSTAAPGRPRLLRPDEA
ncbi:MAG: hypothetical protein R2722_10220 [Tessaracoccus sp.]